MSYQYIEEIPFYIRRCFDEEDLQKWFDTYNEKFEQIKENKVVVPEGYPSNAMYARELAWEACKYLPSSRYVEAIVTVGIPDKQKELADIQSYMDQAPEFVDNGGIGIKQHTSKVVSTVWKAYEGIDPKSGKPCIFTRTNFFRGRKIYDLAWKDILDGYREWSLGSTIDVSKSQIECDTKTCYRHVYADQWFEVSSVYRGANPNTTVTDMNESLKASTDIIDINKGCKACSLKEEYKSFKKDVHKIDESVIIHYLPDETIYIYGQELDRLDDTIMEYYSDRIKSEPISIQGLNHNIIFITEKHDEEITALNIFDEIMTLVEGERTAIADYTQGISFIEGSTIDSKIKEQLIKVIQEIISDEQRHIGTLVESVKIIDSDMNKKISEGRDEVDSTVLKTETSSPCPEGQHQHAGVSGCHDVMRDHHLEGRGNAAGTLDLTDENIDVPFIQKMSDAMLRKMLLRISTVISKYDEKEVNEFLATAGGKEYVLMYLEFKRRTSGNQTPNNTEREKMSEEIGEQKETEVVVETPPVVVDEKCNDTTKEESYKSSPDLLQAIENICAMIVNLKADVGTLRADMAGLKDIVKVGMESKQDISDAVIGEVEASGIGGAPTEDKDGIGGESSPVKDEVKNESDTVEGETDVTEGSGEVDVGAESETKPEGEVSESKPEEGGDESKPEGGDGDTKPEGEKEPDKKAEPENKDEDMTEDKGEKKKTEERMKEDTVNVEPQVTNIETMSTNIVQNEVAQNTFNAYLSRVQDLRLKGLDITPGKDNTVNALTKEGQTVIASTNPSVRIVSTPAPAPFSNAPPVDNRDKNGGKGEIMHDMENLTPKQFMEKRRGVI